MRLVNNTNWDSSDLKKLCLAVIKKVGARGVTKYVTVETATGRFTTQQKDAKNLYSGRASISGGWIVMRVPQPMRNICVGFANHGYAYEKRPEKFCVERFAQVLEHEIGHNLGLRHDNMASSWKLSVGYVKDFVVNPKKIIMKVKQNLVEKRRNHAESMLKMAATRLKRARTLHDKWKKKVKYYASREGMK